MLRSILDKDSDYQERLRVLMRPTSHYLEHVASSSRASLNPLYAIDLLQRQGLQVDSVTARPSSELYSRCKLNNPTDIRLLRLFPAASAAAVDGIEQPLVAQILSGSLVEFKGNYETLSYVWGSDKKPKSIILLFVEPGNESNEAFTFEFNITENLWMALTDLRSLYGSRNIWADAICINQDDNSEKNMQVAQMRDVFAGSKRTLAHLGPRFDGMDALVAFRDCHMTRYWTFPRPMAPDHEKRGQYMHLHLQKGIIRVNQIPSVLVMVLMIRVALYFGLRWGLGLIIPKLLAQTFAICFIAWELKSTLPLMFFKNKFFTYREPEVIFTPEQIVYGLTEFFTRPWFRRVWIVQECVVSPHVCFMLGREQFDIGEVVSMLYGMRDLKSISADIGSAQITAFERMWTMRESRSKSRETPSLPTLLTWAWSSGIGEEATDPRDRIFALLGLLSEDNPAYSIDYAMEVHEVFWRYARVIIQSADGFMLLEDPRRHEGLGMPSWVPDFTKTNNHSLYGANYLYSCSDGVTVHPHQFGPMEKSIKVNAILLEGLDFVGRQYAPIPEVYKEIHHLYHDLSSLPEYSDFLGLNIFAYRANLEPREDIADILKKNPSIRLPKGLDVGSAAEVLFHCGVLLDRTAGLLGAPTNRQLHQAEKYPGTNHTQSLIAKTITAARYFALHIRGACALETSYDFIVLAKETAEFFEDCSKDAHLDRSKLFQRLTETSDVYPHMCQQPLFRALSQEEWPPESLKNDKSIPADILADDQKLYDYWLWSVSYQATNIEWPDRRLVKTPDGVLCNADKDSQIGDRIAFVAGCRMPLILRRREDGSYRVVGHAYAMGLMYGEVMELGIEPERILLS